MGCGGIEGYLVLGVNKGCARNDVGQRNMPGISPNECRRFAADIHEYFLAVVGSLMAPQTNMRSIEVPAKSAWLCQGESSGAAVNDFDARACAAI